MFLQQLRSLPLRAMLAPLVGALALLAVLGGQALRPSLGTTEVSAADITRSVEFDAADYSFSAPDVLPSGMTEDGLPTAIQLDGRAYSENRLLALALAFQRETAWHTAHPDVPGA